MEKLIKLLNEYEKEERKSEFYEWEKWVWWKFNLFRRDTYDEEWSHIYSDTADTFVISKKFWWIKWLIENDKISIAVLCEQELKSWWELNNEQLNGKESWVSYFTENTLMLLAIQDEPIKFLTSLLKNV